MSPPTQMECSSPLCEFKTANGIPSFELVLKCLELHTQTAHGPSASKNSQSKTEKPKRPSASTGMSEADWAFFESRWSRYARQTQLDGQQTLDELWACMDVELERLAFNDGVVATNQITLLAEMKRLAVTILHPSVHIMSLHSMKQYSTETAKTFSARVKGVAGNCDLKKQCTRGGCSETVSYLDETCYHVVLAGLADTDMKEKVLTQAMLGNVKDLTTLINYASAEESAKNQKPLHEVANINPKPRMSTTSKPAQNTCMCCGEPAHGDGNVNRISECKAYSKTCARCGKLNHYASVCRSQKLTPPRQKPQQPQVSEAVVDDVPNISGFICELTAPVTNMTEAQSIVAQLRQSSHAPVTTLPIPHHVYDRVNNQWCQKPPAPSPVIQVTVSVDKAAYKELRLNAPDLIKKPSAGHARARNATTDTGAQLTVINEKELQALGVKKNSIFPLATTVNTVTKSSIDLLGGIFLKFVAYDPHTGLRRETRQLCYVSSSVHGIYLSQDACAALGCISNNFPAVGDCAALSPKPAGKCTYNGVLSDPDTCDCPKRTLPPEDKPVLPCEATPENADKLKKYILNRYASSAFNICERQALPLMETAPPLRLFVDDQATPIAAYSPSTIPIHWVEDVKRGLARDVRLGVIEPVPVNEPVKWCSRMVITPKPDGSPRRVIDFGPINKNAPRQTHHTRSPYVIAASVPANTVKSVLDNWHGYHSVPIHEEDRHLTTFITPFGRYRYKTAPQGFISAGDGYTQRMDLIVEGTQNFDHCVDDSILWDSDIERNFFSVCAYIEKCARAGCTFNPSKFQFGQDEVDFLGFSIGRKGIKPTEKFIKAIMEFPTPSSLTDVRAWFGLINQVSYSFAIAEHMQPFRQLLSSKVPFHWSQELSESFQKSKQEIIRQCEVGVRCFNPQAPTALATDWSRMAVGCWLTQKFCACQSLIPGCCNAGWQTVYVSSKFNSPAVSRYHPIEGEAYAVKWALRKCKFFLLGHPNLKLLIDHKPLLAILGQNQELSELANPRLLDFKLKTMAFRFVPLHIPGKKHVVPDAMSRRPVVPLLAPKQSSQPPEDSSVLPQYADTFGPPEWVATPDLQEDSINAIYMGEVMAMLASLTQRPELSAVMSPAITWEKLESECQKCPTYKLLHTTVLNGFPADKNTWAPQLLPYVKTASELTTLGDVVMLQKRPVIPDSLKATILQHLHAAHSGDRSMIQRASTSFYWPNYAKDIVRHRSQCQSCHVNAPSNPPSQKIPDPDLPTYPFQIVCMDFFAFEGKTYLILVDKYSGWLSVLHLPKDNAASLIKALREYYALVGVSEVVCSDGATVFMAQETQDFFQLWGVKHRVSSAYFPQSNKRAEVGVKSAKRLIRENLGPSGTINSDKFARALMIHRNTPDSLSGVSPAEIVYGHLIRDPLPGRCYAPKKDWADLATKRENAFMKRHFLNTEKLVAAPRTLKPLQKGDHVYVQDQTGATPLKWSKSGVILETLPFNSFIIKIDGSGKITKRNRQFLRKFTPFEEVNKDQPLTSHPNLLQHDTNLTNPSDVAVSIVACEAIDAPLQLAAYIADSERFQFR